MAFSLFYILEACLLIANAVAILNDRFLIKSTFYLLSIIQALFLILYYQFVVGFHVDQMDLSAPPTDGQGGGLGA